MLRSSFALLGVAISVQASQQLLHVHANVAAMNETFKAAASRISNFLIGSQNNYKYIINTSDPLYAATLAKQYQVCQDCNAVPSDTCNRQDLQQVCPPRLI